MYVDIHVLIMEALKYACACRHHLHVHVHVCSVERLQYFLFIDFHLIHVYLCHAG